jgi:hypothetical protein
VNGEEKQNAGVILGPTIALGFPIRFLQIDKNCLRKIFSNYTVSSLRQAVEKLQNFRAVSCHVMLL